MESSDSTNNYTNEYPVFDESTYQHNLGTIAEDAEEVEQLGKARQSRKSANLLPTNDPRKARMRADQGILSDQTNKMDAKERRAGRKRVVEVEEEIVELKRRSQTIIQTAKHSNRPPTKEPEKKISFQLISLRSLDGTHEKFFKVFKDEDLGLDFSRFGDNLIIESHQDDDVETENEVLDNGTQTCYKDLLVVKAALKNPADKVRRALRTFRLWSPLFSGILPPVIVKTRTATSQPPLGRGTVHRAMLRH